MLITLVGKSGSGKTTIAKKLESLDERILHVDIDQISHQVLEFPEVQERIKKEISYDCVIDEEVQRKVLGRIVFASPEHMQVLTDITWSKMENIIDQIIASNPDRIIILDYALLPKTKYFDQSDLRIWVESPIEERLERAIKRAVHSEPITRDYFLKRDAAGIDYEEGKYDIVIHNTNKNDINKEVKKVYEKSIVSR